MRLLVVFLFLLTILPASAYAGPLRIFTSVLPIKTLTEQIGGQHVVVQALVRPGFDPHTYEPTPQQVVALSQANLYIRVGMPFEQTWVPRIRSANQQMQFLDAQPLVSTHAHQHDIHAHASDPHAWTSPVAAQQMALRIRDKLIALAPQYTSTFRQNHANLAQALGDLHDFISQRLAPFSGQKFLVFHPAWGHFAETYQLHQIAIQQEGKEPGIRTLANSIQQAIQADIRIIFAQPQFDQRLAAQVAKAIGGKVVLVDPLAADYSNNLRQVAENLARALLP